MKIKKYIFLLTLSFFEALSLQAQSIFDAYGASTTNLDAVPYSSFDLDAMDFNPAGNVFLREGVELSLNSLWPRCQTIRNSNTFKVRDFTVNRSCEDRSKLGMPSPSGRISWRFGDHALAFSYSHAENHFEGNGNAFFDDMMLRQINESLSQSLNVISSNCFNQNNSANSLSSLVFNLYAVEIPAPFAFNTEFPLAILSTSTEYTCIGDKFSLSYTHRIKGHNEPWEFFSVFTGLKAQRMAWSSDIILGLYTIEQSSGTIVPYTDFCDKYATFYYRLADSITELSDYFVSMGQSYENMAHFSDSAFNAMPYNYSNMGWGLNAELGFNIVRPYWNLAAKAEFGSMPFEFSLGYMQHVGRLQLSMGGDFGFASKKLGLYSKLFGSLLDDKGSEYYFGSIGFEVAGHIGDNLTLRGGLSYGFNKDILINSGFALMLKKSNSLSPSCSLKWNLSSLLSLVCEFKTIVPCENAKYLNAIGIYGNAKYMVEPEYQFLIGFIAHLE